MENSRLAVPSISYILKRLSDDKTLALLHSIAISGEIQNIPLKKMSLTTKQYYGRVSGLADAGLIKRHRGKYSLTPLGKVVYESQMIIGKTLTYYWKLKVLDFLETSTCILQNEEMTQLINSLIDDKDIKDNLLEPIFVGSNENIPAPMISSLTDNRKKQDSY
jgi:hypothetical protein